MTYTKKVTLVCDGDELEDGPSEDCEHFYGHEVTYTAATEARFYAREDGWVTDGSKDYCPHCFGLPPSGESEVSPDE